MQLFGRDLFVAGITERTRQDLQTILEIASHLLRDVVPGGVQDAAQGPAAHSHLMHGILRTDTHGEIPML